MGNLSFDPNPPLTPLGMGALLRTVQLVGTVSMRTSDSPPTNSVLQSAIPAAKYESNVPYLPTYLKWNKQKFEKITDTNTQTHFSAYNRRLLSPFLAKMACEKLCMPC